MCVETFPLQLVPKKAEKREDETWKERKRKHREGDLAPHPSNILCSL